MNAIHIICHRDGGELKGLSHISGTTHYLSECWAINDDEAARLAGGWVYFHPTKQKPSEFGGRIITIALGQRIDAAVEIGKIFTIEARREGRGQTWRGKDHGRAWTGGVVSASLPHER